LFRRGPCFGLLLPGLCRLHIATAEAQRDDYDYHKFHDQPLPQLAPIQ
jgi:hypothetical protein